RLTLYAEQMTAEASFACPDSIQVGTFDVVNSGYPGGFTATVEAPVSPVGPAVEVYPPEVTSGETVTVFADTTGLAPGVHTIYVNVTATIGGDLVSEMIQGYVVVRQDAALCSD